MKKKMGIFVFISFFIAGSAFGDMIKLKNGRDVEGIVEEQNDKIVKLRIKIGTINFTPAEIDAVIIATKKQNDELEKSWAEEKAKSTGGAVKEEKNEETAAEPAVPEISKIETSAGAIPEENNMTGSETPIEPSPAIIEEKVEELPSIPERQEPPAEQIPEALSEPAGEINWLDDYSGGIIKASQKQMPVIIDFYTDWCGWCKKLDAEVYTDSRVVSGLKNFIAIKVDADQNKDLTAKYSVTGYPTILFLNSQGKEIDRIRGFVGADDFLKKVNEVLSKK